jgi:4-hydroxybenzoate polyprenyltransferase
MIDPTKPSASDIPETSWFDRFVPDAAKPYLRLARIDRPIGTWLLLLPCWWSIALASPSWPDPWLFVLFAVGAVAMRGAGCTLNDIADRDYDKNVQRTAGRPIPSGQVTVKQAVGFLALQSLIGLAVLLQLNAFSILLGAASLLIVAIYPFMKRITYWPQFVLGLAFNWGALLGWAAVRGDLAAPALLLYAAGILWTLGYDTIYAHQDKQDDLLIGVKSTALRLGDATRPWLAVFYSLTMILLAASGYGAGLCWPFFALLAVSTAHLAWQVAKVDTENPADCLKKFKSNRVFGFLVLAAIVAGQV